MKSASRLFRSTLGRKYIMAVSGAALLVFVVVHLAGNLQIFIGADTLNAYGHFLQQNPAIVWFSRAGLLGLVGLHIWAAATLTRENRAARPQDYVAKKPIASSYASRTMLMSGIIIVLFVIYHLLHFTVQSEAINLTGQDFGAFMDEEGRHDVYRMMVVGFSNLLVSGFYIVAIALLALHLSHGVSSMFQSMGWRMGPYAKVFDHFAIALAIVIFVGYASIPIAVLLGFVK